MNDQVYASLASQYARYAKQRARAEQWRKTRTLVLTAIASVLAAGLWTWGLAEVVWRYWGVR